MQEGLIFYHRLHLSIPLIRPVSSPLMRRDLALAIHSLGQSSSHNQPRAQATCHAFAFTTQFNQYSQDLVLNKYSVHRAKLG